MSITAVAGPAEDAGYEIERERGALVVALPSVMADVMSLVREHGTLYDAAAAQPDAQSFTGRGAAYRMSLAREDCVVRHYRRGGAVARVLHDEYLRTGEPRPLRELHASIAARSRGVDTPEVLTAIMYLAGPLYRADLATRFVRGSRDLATVTFGADNLTREASPESAPERAAAWHAAGLLLRTAFAAGVEHADLNLRNILITGPAADAGSGSGVAAGGRPRAGGDAGAGPGAGAGAGAERTTRALLLDLDRATVREEPVSGAARSSMLARLHRSREKLEKQTGVKTGEDALAAFEAGLRGRG
ncbi:MAG TPA: lipopolysaccharide kinase InaA family protein [Longimicrobiales bacterium]|nr:lipopolysaccharide kinase InaA family protein [Longimicrobiales bacterium]